MPVADQSTVATVAIANGATTSATQTLGGDTLVGVITPAALTSTALTFQGSTDGTTWYTVLGFDGATFSQTVTTSTAYPLPPGIFAMYDYVRVVGGSTEGGARTLTLLTMPSGSVPPNSRVSLTGNTLIARPAITVDTAVYAAGDNVGGVITVTGAVRVSGGTSTLQDMALTDLGNQRAQLEIRFFGANPTAGTYTDNAATVLHATDQAHALGRVTVYLSDWLTNGSIATATLRNIGLGMQAEGGTSIWMVITTGAINGAPDYVTASDLSMKLTFQAD